MRRSLLIATAAVFAVAGTVLFFIWSIGQRPGQGVLPPASILVVIPEPTGALIDTRMESRVGVLLDEIPADDYKRLERDLFAKPVAFWKERATKQVRFTTLRRNYGISYGDKPLPLPPEELWHVTVTSEPRRETVDNHEYVLVDYAYDGTLLTDFKSPGESAPALGAVGGTFEDKLILPMDPEFVFQRTRFACMNESESPPNSIDAEEADFFYDQKCRVESKLTNIGCHQTEMPTESCEEAVVAHIGTSRPTMTFERLPWSMALADQVRLGEITNPDGPDLQPIQSRFNEHRVTYRYIPSNSCTLVEKCVGGFGWRQLLMFPTGDLNSGAKPLDIGRVDYFHNEGGSLLAEHGVYELSECHGHYHFSHYGSFTLGDGSQAITHKQGFCLQPTSRLMNNEQSPLNHPYTNCLDQGVSVGWLDEYNMGLECQWLDVSDVDPQTYPLSFTTNPDGMMCEGTRKFDAEGKQLFEPTEFKTVDGKPVDRPQCDFFPDWAANNVVAYEVTIPSGGESYITEPCAEGTFGALRNCGFTRGKKLSTCEPDGLVAMRCDVPASSPSQVLRVCEASKGLRIGIPCTFGDSLTTEIVHAAKEISFACPSARDEVETGGLYSFFTGALFPEQASANVTCTAIGQLSFQKRLEENVFGRIEIDVPAVKDIPVAAVASAVRSSLLSLEADIDAWRQTPGLNERSSYTRSCLPLAINGTEILFQCTVQAGIDENEPAEPITTVYGLDAKTGAWLDSEEAKNRAEANSTPKTGT